MNKADELLKKIMGNDPYKIPGVDEYEKLLFQLGIHQKYDLEVRNHREKGDKEIQDFIMDSNNQINNFRLKVKQEILRFRLNLSKKMAEMRIKAF